MAEKEKKEQTPVPVSEENIAPDGSLIVDSPFKTKEMMEAVTKLKRRKVVSVWWLKRRW